MNASIPNSVDSNHAGARRIYSSPRLFVYGSMRALTAAASQGMSDEGAMVTDFTRKK